jgi:hypothetical protein
MARLSRKQIETIFIFLGVVLVVSGFYSSITYSVSFMSVLYLAVGFYLIIVSVVRINKLDKPHAKLDKPSAKVEKKNGKEPKKPKL